MAIQFQSLTYQEKAVEAVTDLFRGQEEFDSFKLSQGTKKEGELYDAILGMANSLILEPEDILNNLNQIQVKNDLPISNKEDFEKAGMNFTVEMETGTGKTYVYLRTILRLYKQYKWKKFIIIVPSIAIRAGVIQALELLSQHFFDQEGIRLLKGSNYRVYDGNLSDIKSFARAGDLQILIMNIQSFNKENARLNTFREDDSTTYPIEYLIHSRPILILDEPQKIDANEWSKGREAIEKLDSLFNLRYSATHKELFNQVFRFGPVEAFEGKYVKKIEVDEKSIEGNENLPYLKLISISRNRQGQIVAELELYEERETDRKLKKIKINSSKDKWDLKNLSNNTLYDGHIVTGLSLEEGKERISFSDGKPDLFAGETWSGNIEVLESERIKETIKIHFEKELAFHNALKNGIISAPVKVLSLFFIDKVKNYKNWENGNQINGKFFELFEKHYQEISKLDKFKDLKIFPVDQVHDGYFSGQKGKEWKDGENEKDLKAVFELIMEKKEALLDQNEPLRFIFSHSALQEGWDNPNVFQICTLLDATSLMKKRQQIGRGLRLPVDSNGRRLPSDLHDTFNKLTVVVSQSYESFAKELQKELENDGIEFGKLKKSHLVRLVHSFFPEESEKKSEDLIQVLIKRNYIDQNGNFQDSLISILQDGSMEELDLGEEFHPHKEDIRNWLKVRQVNNLIRKRKDPNILHKTKDREKLAVFEEFWKIVSQKTFYRFSLDTENLILECARSLGAIVCEKPKIRTRKAGLQTSFSSIQTQLNVVESNEISHLFYDIPNPIQVLESKTDLTRDTLIKIIKQANNLDQFLNNPHEYLRLAVLRIQEIVRNMSIPGIEYIPLPDSYYSLSQIFMDNLPTDQRKIHESPNKGYYDKIPCDSDSEKFYAKRLEDLDKVTLFTKIPRGFKIPTPLGYYSPDWMIVEKEREDKRPIFKFFIKETKGYKDKESIPKGERQKIKSAKRHFEILRDSYKQRIQFEGKNENEIPDFEFHLVIGQGTQNSDFIEISDEAVLDKLDKFYPV